jgi:hypothetical protein
MDIARLGLAVDSSPVEKGTVALHQLTGAAGQASAAARQLAGASTAEAAGHRTATAATQAHTAALMANNAAMRNANFQRTNLIFQLNDIGVSLASGMNPLMVAIQQGSQIATIYGPGEGGIGRAFRETGNIAVTAATKFWPLAAAIGIVGAGLAGLTYEINQASDVTVSMGDVALATWQVISSGIYNFVKPAIDAIGPAFKQAWDFSVDFTVNALEGIARAVAGAMVVIKAGFSSIAPALKIAGETGANFFLSAFDAMVNEALKGVQRLLDVLRLLQPAARLIPNAYDANSPFASQRIDIGGAAAANQMVQTWSRDVPEQLASTAQWTPLRDFFGAIMEQAESNALGQATQGINEMAGAVQAANDNIWSMSDALGQLGPAAVDPLTLLQQQMGGLNQLLGEGRISWEQYGEAAFRANSGAASAVLGLTGQLTGALGQMFEDNKAFAIANAVVNTAEGITKALATYGPTPWGFAAAGVAAATGAAQIAAIMSAQKGSGSLSRPGAAPSQPASGSDSGGVARSLNVTVYGEVVSTKSIESMVAEINEFLRDSPNALTFNRG